MDNSIPWIEKYRQDNIDNVMLDDYTRKQVNVFITEKKNAHLIITGVPGVGKTTTARCIAKKLLGENISEGFLELNAAEDGGAKNMILTIPSFCKKITKSKCSKIIVLDEADIITQKCQYDINNIIKKFGENTRFIFICNDSSKIIEDIQSVCRILRFKKISDEQISIYLKKICESENVIFETPGLDMLCYISEGDLRKAINNLQKTSYTFDKVSKETVLKICKIPDPNDINKVINLCFDQDLQGAVKQLENIIKDGYYYTDIIIGFSNVIERNEIKEETKIHLIEIINRYKIIMSNGLKSSLQLFAMLCNIIKFIKNIN